MRPRSTIVAVLLFAAGLVLAAALGRLHPVAADRHEGTDLRVICIGPSVTETLFALGVGDRVVGVDDFSLYPPEATRLEHVGGAITPNLEKILALHPDLVITQGVHEKTAAFCRANGIHVLNMDVESLANVYAGVRALGARLGVRREAEELCERMATELDAVRRQVARLPKVPVFLCMWRSPDSLAGLGTTNGTGFLSGLLELAGGVNIFADTPVRYSQISKEALVMRQPEVIIELRPGEDIPPAKRARLLADWDQLPSLPAVRNGRVYILTDDFLLLPGPRVARTAQRLAQVVHGTGGDGVGAGK